VYPGAYQVATKCNAQYIRDNNALYIGARISHGGVGRSMYTVPA